MLGAEGRFGALHSQLGCALAGHRACPHWQVLLLAARSWLLLTVVPLLVLSPPHLQSTEPSPELYERVALGGADAAAAAVPPEGFYPRSKSVSPVQRKIAQLEVG